MNRFDVLVAGAGVAGLSAALVFGRTRRKTLVCGSGPTRNAPTAHAHNYLSRDGISPQELIKVSREQIEVYPTVRFSDQWITDGAAVEGGFELEFATGECVFARKVVVATGIVDDLPDVKGLRERWGRSVFHCPFCDAWEWSDQPWVLYGNDKAVFDLATMARAWTDRITICSDGVAEASDEQRRRLAANGIDLNEKKVDRVEGEGTTLERIVFEDGSEVACRALFTRTKRRQRSDLAVRLGCALTEMDIIEVDAMGQTTVPGIYGAGDAIEPGLQTLPFAGYSGFRAAAAVSKALFEEDFA